jgi:hypothetical protein
MVHVGHVGMRVLEPTMTMRMGVRFAGRVLGQVWMLMVLVMHVGMRVHQRLMDMLVLVVLGHMQPDARRHEDTGRNEGHGHRLPERGDGDDGAKKRSGREVGPGSRGPEMTEGDNEQRKTHSVP